MMTADKWMHHWSMFSEMRLPDGGYPYAPGLRSSVEPTVHAVLAGLAGGVTPGDLAASLRWLSGRRNQDGSVPCFPEYPDQGLWITAPYTIAMAKAGDARSASSAADFLLSFVSITVQNTKTNDLDGSLIGWPWGRGAFSWVEPTAWGLLALEAAGKGDHPRAEEGRKLLVDRQIPTGGWNYGNKSVYGQELIPFADTTALGLLALCGRVPDSSIEISIKFLEMDMETQESPYGLALSALALRRCRRTSSDAALNRLETFVPMMAGERLNSVHLGLALQALAPRGVLWE